MIIKFYFYIIDYIYIYINRNGDNLANLPLDLPKNFKNITITRSFEYSYYMNVCTFSYSALWLNHFII